MRIFVLGTSHAVASALVREQLPVRKELAAPVLTRLTGCGRPLDEAVLLVTCARVEVYGVSPDPDRTRRVLEHLARQVPDTGGADLGLQTYFHVDEQAVEHLFRVAAGLDSVVQGESQILGQVRELLAAPEHSATLGPLLHRLVQHAVRTGKRVRAETEIGQGTASLASAGLELLRRRTGGLAGRGALVVGAGETGTLVARLLAKAGVARLAVANRTPGRARAVAEPLGGSGHGLDELDALLGWADLIVGAATAPAPLVTPGLLEPDERRRFFLDLSHPRSLDPELAGLDGSELLDLDAVHRQVEAARRTRQNEAPRAEAIVAEEVDRYVAWYRERRSFPVVRAVRERVLELAYREAENQGRSLEPEQRGVLMRFAHSLARSLLHGPTMALRQADPDTPEGRRVLEAAGVLFGLERGVLEALRKRSGAARPRQVER